MRSREKAGPSVELFRMSSSSEDGDHRLTPTLFIDSLAMNADAFLHAPRVKAAVGHRTPQRVMTIVVSDIIVPPSAPMSFVNPLERRWHRRLCGVPDDVSDISYINRNHPDRDDYTVLSSVELRGAPAPMHELLSHLVWFTDFKWANGNTDDGYVTQVHYGYDQDYGNQPQPASPQVRIRRGDRMVVVKSRKSLQVLYMCVPIHDILGKYTFMGTRAGGKKTRRHAPVRVRQRAATPSSRLL